MCAAAYAGPGRPPSGLNRAAQPRLAFSSKAGSAAGKERQERSAARRHCRRGGTSWAAADPSAHHLKLQEYERSAAETAGPAGRQRTLKQAANASLQHRLRRRGSPAQGCSHRRAPCACGGACMGPVLLPPCADRTGYGFVNARARHGSSKPSFTAGYPGSES